MTDTARQKAQATDDEALAQRISRGDREAMTLLMRRYNQTLYRTARSILKDEAEAEDAVQEAYLHAFRAMPNFRGQSKLSTWLIRIAANEALGRLRRSKRRAEVIVLNEDQPHLLEDANPVVQAADVTVQPDTLVLRDEMRQIIEAKIDRLPEAFRTVFVLRAVEELSVEETADCLGIPPATVRTRFFRARSLLREAIASETDVALESAFGFAGDRCDRIVAGVLARVEQPFPGP